MSSIQQVIFTNSASLSAYGGGTSNPSLIILGSNSHPTSDPTNSVLYFSNTTNLSRVVVNADANDQGYGSRCSRLYLQLYKNDVFQKQWLSPVLPRSSSLQPFTWDLDLTSDAFRLVDDTHHFRLGGTGCWGSAVNVKNTSITFHYETLNTIYEIQKIINPDSGSSSRNGDSIDLNKVAKTEPY